MTAEAIAKVSADLRAGRIKVPPLNGPDDVRESVLTWAKKVAGFSGPTVDATAIYRSIMDRDEPVYLYEDHPSIAPPFYSAHVAYENEHGNVITMAMVVADGRDPRVENLLSWEPAEPVDLERLRWAIHVFGWIGGRSELAGGRIPTIGPVHAWSFAVYEDGEPADLHWVQLLPQHPREMWDNAQLVLLGALNFLNCVNVELVEPKRPRPEARRIARTGVKVHTINVFPTGRASSSRSTRQDPSGVPLTTVRGHFACYGPRYGRGLLFGKHEGRFFIPQHARGTADVGESQADYRLVPDRRAGSRDEHGE